MQGDGAMTRSTQLEPSPSQLTAFARPPSREDGTWDLAFPIR